MEEQRISRMYLNLVAGWFSRTWGRLFPRGLMRSPLFFLAGLAALVLVPSVGWYLHVHGKFHNAKTDLGVTQVPAGPVAPRPGGAEAMVLQRTQSTSGAGPEFLSATLLPGLGMGVLQITASLPGRGDVPLLVAPTAQQLADNPAGPRSGSMDDHGSLEVPWGGTISGLISPLGSSLSTTWKGHTITVSRDPQERSGLAEGGMLGAMPADSAQLTPNSTGGFATASFHATDFAEHWLSRTDVSVTAELGPRTLELTVTAKNVGEEAEPMGIGWQPRFAIPAGDRSAVELRLPNGEQMEIGDRARNLPSGRMVAAGEALSRYQGRAATLSETGLDETMVHLRPALLDSESGAEFRDPVRGYGLRIVAASPSIQALHVMVPAGADYVSLGMQTNYDDALGKEWNGDGIVTLSPGQSLEWKVRLEIFAITKR